MQALPSHNNLGRHFTFSLSIVMLLEHLQGIYKEPSIPRHEQSMAEYKIQ